MIDERTEELAALHAFGLLEGSDRVAFAARMQGDPALRRLADELTATAGACAHLAAESPPSPGLRKRVLDTISSGEGGRGTGLPPSGGNGGGFRLPPWTGWAAAALFALLAAYLGVTVSRLEYQLTLINETLALSDSQLRSLDTSLESERIVSKEQTIRLKTAETRVADLNAELERTRSAALAQVAELKARADVASLHIASLRSLLGDAPDAGAVAVWNPFSQEGLLTVSHLPTLPEGKDYQLWVVDPQYPIPVDGGVFTVDADGAEVRYHFKANKPVATVAKFAVSLERKGGVPKAEGPMVLISP